MVIESEKCGHYVSLRKQPSFLTPGLSGVLQEGRLRFTAENFHTDDGNLSRIWSWVLIGSIGNYA